MRKYLPLALIVVFFLIAFNAFLNSTPAKKTSIYYEIKKYSPYYLEKRFGGLVIKSKTDKDFIQKPSNLDVYKKLDSLEREWGKKHLTLNKNKLLIYNDKKLISTINIQNQEDKIFLYEFYGIK